MIGINDEKDGLEELEKEKNKIKEELNRLNEINIEEEIMRF